MSSVYKFLHATGMQHIFRKTLKGNTLTILALHRISDEPNYFWNPIPPKSFDKLCQYVSKHYHVINFSQIDDYRHAKKPLLILSFDDGYQDFLENALPILQKHGLTANQNIVYECAANNMPIWTQRLNTVFQFLYAANNNTAIIELNNQVKTSLALHGGNWRTFYNSVFLTLVRLKQAVREPIVARLELDYGVRSEVEMMNWAGIHSAIAAGIEIGNHTWSHDVVATIEDDDTMNKEVVASKLKLEEALQIPISIFSLPNGETTGPISESIQQAGYKYVLELNERTNKLNPIGSNNNIFNRITIGDEPIEKMILRAETFQSTMHKFFK